MNLLRRNTAVGEVRQRSHESIDDLSARLVRPRLTRNFMELASSVDQLARGPIGTDMIIGSGPGGGAGGRPSASGYIVRPRMADGMEAAHEILAPRQFDLQQHNRDIVNLQSRVEVPIIVPLLEELERNTERGDLTASADVPHTNNYPPHAQSTRTHTTHKPSPLPSPLPSP